MPFPGFTDEKIEQLAGTLDYPPKGSTRAGRSKDASYETAEPPSNLIIGCVTMAICVVIQCVVVSVMIRTLIRVEGKRTLNISRVQVALILMVVMLILLGDNLLQVSVWATLFYAYGEFQEFSVAFYHSTLNFSTLGYGDLVMSNENRLLGAMEAVNGVLMIGLTTGVLFPILSDFMDQAWNARNG